MARRIFIAINLPERIKKDLSAFQEKWPEIPVRWVKPENIHITLAFLGYVNDEELLLISRTAREVASRTPSFVVNLVKVIYGPPQKIPSQPPKMIWAVGEKSEEFTELQRDLEKSLAGQEKVYFSSERREFFPHVTLGRIRQWEWKRIEEEERPAVEEEINLSFPVDSIEVMESDLKRGGAEYIVLESHGLSKL